jgi:diadenosine tetraphosphate (Ap4A) HIT family hydrolase
MTRQITDISGNMVEVECIGCAIAQGTVEVRGGSVINTEYFDVSQDFEVPIPGFMIIATKRHLSSVDQFTDEEAAEFTRILQETRRLQREVLGIESVYIHQEEDTSDHFHVWMLPRHEWMLQFGRKVESMRPIMDYARKNLKTEENLALLDVDTAKLKAAASLLSF